MSSSHRPEPSPLYYSLRTLPCSAGASGSSTGFARSVSDMDDDLGVPNCERCLVPMVIEGTDEGPYWCCPECRIVRLA